MKARRFERSGEVALSGTPERAASRTADAVPSRGGAPVDFLKGMFSIVTESQLALDGNYDRVCCLKHVGTEGSQDTARDAMRSGELHDANTGSRTQGVATSEAALRRSVESLALLASLCWVVSSSRKYIMSVNRT